MKEITENGIKYSVSDSYPKAPYVKVAVTAPSEIPVDPIEELKAKMDQVIATQATMKADLAAVKVQTATDVKVP